MPRGWTRLVADSLPDWLSDIAERCTHACTNCCAYCGTYASADCNSDTGSKREPKGRANPISNCFPVVSANDRADNSSHC